MIEIKALNAENAGLLWQVEDRRLDSEKVLVRPQAAGFALSYKPLPGALWRVGNAEKAIDDDADELMANPTKAVFFAWLEGNLAGQVYVQKIDYSLACVRDVRVQMSLRRKGIGAALMAMAEDWARHKKLGGVMVETQDTNAAACQFLTKCGYMLGGIDTMRYIASAPHTLKAAALRDSALFFYKFNRE